MDSDESHLNVSLTVRSKITRQHPKTTTVLRERTAKLICLLTSLTNTLLLAQTTSQAAHPQQLGTFKTKDSRVDWSPQVYDWVQTLCCLDPCYFPTATFIKDYPYMVIHIVFALVICHHWPLFSLCFGTCTHGMVPCWMGSTYRSIQILSKATAQLHCIIILLIKYTFKLKCDFGCVKGQEKLTAVTIQVKLKNKTLLE